MNNNLIGKVLTKELEEELTETFSNLRIQRPGCCYTCDWRPFRTNVIVDENDVITDIKAG